MTVYAIDKVIRCTYNWQLSDGGLAQNVWHFATPATCDQGDVDDLASSAQQLFTTNYGTHEIIHYLHDTVTLESVDTRTIDPSNPLAQHVSIGTTGAVGGSPPVPLESAVVTTLYTGLVSRRGRGRTFLAGLASGETDGGKLYGPVQADIEGGYQGFINGPITAFSGEPVLWSPTNNNARSFTSAETRPVLHHQRRRNR